MSHHTNATMAVACGGAGIYAFYKKRSMPSLIASTIFASAFGVSTYLIQSNTNPQLGHDIGAAASGILGLTMGMRAFKTRASVPIFLTIAGTANLAFNAKKSINYRAPVELDDDQETPLKNLQ